MGDVTAKASGPDSAALDKKIRACEQRIKGSSRAIAEAPADVPLDSVYAQLREDTGLLADLRRRRGALDHGERPVTRMPTVSDMKSFGEELLNTLEGDPADANAALRAAIPSPAVLVPGNDDAGPVLTMAGKVKVSGTQSCGGRI